MTGFTLVQCRDMVEFLADCADRCVIRIAAMAGIALVGYAEVGKAYSGFERIGIAVAVEAILRCR